MIVAKCKDGELMIGFSEENLKRLRAHKPIKLQLSDYGLPAQSLFIFADSTEQEIIRKLRAAEILPADVPVHGEN